MTRWQDRIPWHVIKACLWIARKATSSKPEPDGPYILAECSHELLRKTLGTHHFEPHWELSYSYRGEVENLRRVTWTDDDYPWFQTHVRSWDVPDGERTATNGGQAIKVRAHWEPESVAHPVAHLDGVGFERTRAMRTLRGILDEAGIPNEFVA
ncbi:hypothetical protein [Halomarina litorea]|uniref:hypothetical protein n=1 Tax=Halomarina litorea TaxID=2961595 RepID=UPI0020C3E3E2|nr:hypothetical protein [Halomarina sp. BCD28]